jgi:hypothetical protein
MDYSGTSRYVRVRINAEAEGHWKEYVGQECDAIIYEDGISPHVNSEQLNPPLPKYQSIKASWVDIL